MNLFSVPYSKTKARMPAKKKKKNSENVEVFKDPELTYHIYQVFLQMYSTHMYF